jgi:hypothetical protein
MLVNGYKTALPETGEGHPDLSSPCRGSGSLGGYAGVQRRGFRTAATGRNRASQPLVGNRELQVWPRDFQNDILAVFDQGHPSVPVSIWPTDRLEFDIDLEIRTVPTDERPPQSRRKSTFSRENREQSLSGHPWLDCLHSLQTLSDPSHVIFGGWPPVTLNTCLKRWRGTDRDTCK